MDDFENKDRGFNGAEQEGGTTRIDMPRRHRREEAPEDAPEREKRDVAGRTLLFSMGVVPGLCLG